MKVIFEEPHTPNRRAPWPERLEPLKKRPGEWARVFTSKDLTAARRYVSALSIPGRYRLPNGEFEFRAGELPGGGGAVYARYVGEA